MDVLKRFPRVWCPTCDKTQPMIFDLIKANDKNDHDAADIVCADCKSIIATLHAPSADRAGGRTKKAAKALEMAGQEIERLSDPSATDGNAASGGFSRGRKSFETFEASVNCMPPPQQ